MPKLAEAVKKRKSFITTCDFEETIGRTTCKEIMFIQQTAATNRKKREREKAGEKLRTNYETNQANAVLPNFFKNVQKFLLDQLTTNSFQKQH